MLENSALKSRMINVNDNNGSQKSSLCHSSRILVNSKQHVRKTPKNLSIDLSNDIESCQKLALKTPREVNQDLNDVYL